MANDILIKQAFVIHPQLDRADISGVRCRGRRQWGYIDKQGIYYSAVPDKPTRFVEGLALLYQKRIER